MICFLVADITAQKYNCFGVVLLYISAHHFPDGRNMKTLKKLNITQFKTKTLNAHMFFKIIKGNCLYFEIIIKI